METQMSVQINGSDTVFLSFKVETEMKAILSELAKRKDRPVSWLIRKAIRQYLERESARHVEA
jgi:predicted transcriptional regulator